MANVFIISPFGEPFDGYYREVIRPALDAAGHSVLRADDIFALGTVMTAVYQSIAESDLIIADTTGVNANVFYELGIAHSLRKPVIIMTQSSDTVPFDIRHLRNIVYRPSEAGWSC